MFISFLNVQYTPSYPFQFTYKFYVQSKYLYFDQKSINIQQRPINIVRFVRTPIWFPICFQPRECACSRACSSYQDFAMYSQQSNSNFFKLSVQQYQWSTDYICTRVCSAQVLCGGERCEKVRGVSSHARAQLYTHSQLNTINMKRQRGDGSTGSIANLIFFAGNSQPYSPHYCMSAYNR